MELLIILLLISIIINYIQYIYNKRLRNKVSEEIRKQLVYKTELNMPQRDYLEDEKGWEGTAGDK